MTVVAVRPRTQAELALWRLAFEVADLLQDVIRMLALVDDVEAVRAQLKPAERRALGRMKGLWDPGAANWRVLPFPQDAQAAWARLHDD